MHTTRRTSARIVPPALSIDALYGKAALYARRSLQAKDKGEEDAYQLWATLSLELLGKFALARIHPSLVVDAKNPNSALEACGISTATVVKTIDANEVFLRLKHVVPGFNSLAYDACKLLADRRNAELHSGHAAYVGIELEEWEGKLWHAMRLILQATGKDLDDLIGDAAAKKEQLLDHLSHLKRESASQKVAHSREAFKMDSEGKRRTQKAIDSLREESKTTHWWQHARHLNAHFERNWDRICPACGCRGILGGEKDYEELTDNQEEMLPGYEEVETTYTPVAFLCPYCDLRLDGTDELSVAGMDDEVTEVEEREISYEPDYGND